MSERTPEDIEAAYAFRETLLERADAWAGVAPLWHGWAVAAGYFAGLDAGRADGTPRAGGRLTGEPYTLNELKMAAAQPPEHYHRTLMEWAAGEIERLSARVAELERLSHALADRVEKQSELLSRKAGRPVASDPDFAPPGDFRGDGTYPVPDGRSAGKKEQGEGT